MTSILSRTKVYVINKLMNGIAATLLMDNLIHITDYTQINTNKFIPHSPLK